ncbi:MAG: DUF2127 domain-containing protein [Candidatus Acidiferrales bacterium]
MKQLSRTLLKSTFRTGITFKGIDGVLETVGGVLFLLFPPSKVNAIVTILSQHELSHDPHDFIAIHVLRLSEKLLSSNKLFAALYLLSHGLTKVILVVGLWMNALWAYPLTIGVFAAFSVYQTYRYSHTHSIVLLFLTIFDVALIYLTWMEWREQEAERAKGNSPRAK